MRQFAERYGNIWAWMYWIGKKEDASFWNHTSLLWLTMIEHYKNHCFPRFPFFLDQCFRRNNSKGCHSAYLYYLLFSQPFLFNCFHRSATIMFNPSTFLCRQLSVEYFMNIHMLELELLNIFFQVWWINNSSQSKRLS